MSQQGDRPATADDWWGRLYDESAPDTGPAETRDDTIDDRFDSAADTLGGRYGQAVDAIDVADEEDPGDEDEDVGALSGGPVSRPLAWWEARGAYPVIQAPEPPPPPRPTVADVPLAPPPPAPAPVAPPPPRAPRQRAPWEPPPPAFSPSDARPLPGAVDPPPPSAPEPEPPAKPAPAPPAPAPAAPKPPAPAADTPPPRDPRAAHEPPQAPAPAPAARSGHVGDSPPTYDAEPTALPASRADELGQLVADTVLDGARYGTYTLRAASMRGDSARYRGEPRRDALLTARFGVGPSALVLVAVATGARATEGAHLAAADACRWIGGAVGRSHSRLAEDIRAGRRGDLKSGLHRLTDRTYGKLRARAGELGREPDEYTASLRCLLLSADPDCRTRVFFGVGGGGLFRLRDGAWQDLEPLLPEPADITGAPVLGFGSAPADALAEQSPDGDRLTMDLEITKPPGPVVEAPVPPPPEPFRFRASVARPADTLLLTSVGLAEPLRGEPGLGDELAARWASGEPPGLAAFLADVGVRVKGYADDRTAVAVWEA
ncbi:protein phosphatase 2C domain-containing protein [Streptomyces sp. NBC_01716]|uniref:protein phosphatase 2C domain-containing protein n=1 Tax=Streptomyces sp. NBC_01716 TaxID=2975917 RepID=UPI002E329379|nr:protein phosphatase 2C domain-containing protein [Streptomyces sp. NBC_01716]